MKLQKPSAFSIVFAVLAIVCALGEAALVLMS